MRERERERVRDRERETEREREREMREREERERERESERACALQRIVAASQGIISSSLLRYYLQPHQVLVAAS